MKGSLVRSLILVPKLDISLRKKIIKQYHWWTEKTRSSLNAKQTELKYIKFKMNNSLDK